MKSDSDKDEKDVLIMLITMLLVVLLLMFLLLLLLSLLLLLLLLLCGFFAVMRVWGEIEMVLAMVKKLGMELERFWGCFC